MVECRRTYCYFDGITFSADRKELILAYSDPDQGGTRLLFRYLLSLAAAARLVTGYGPELAGIGKEIEYKEIPQDVVCDACDWLRSNLDAARQGNQEQLCRILSDYLKLLETGESPKPRPDRPGESSQRNFRW